MTTPRVRKEVCEVVPDAQPKLLTIKQAAKVIGVDVETVRAWTKRAIDPLPTAPSGPGTGNRDPRRRVVAPLIDEWLERNSNKEDVSCA